jgi:hypothetical protein
MRLLLALALLLPSLAYSQAFQYNYSVVCGPTTAIVEFLTKAQQEMILWDGSHIDDGSKYTLWQDKSGNWTLLKMTREVSCIVGSGTKGSFGTII